MATKPLFLGPGILIMLVLLVQPAFPQDRCGTDYYMKQLRDQGKIKQTDDQFEQWMARKMYDRQVLRTLGVKGGPYQVPVVVHVIHNGEPVGTGTNISDEQIHSQIAVLNRDFNRLNPDAINTPAEFAVVAGSMDIEFVMARRDPNGLPTTAINRVQGTKQAWSRVSDDAVFKALSFWPSTDYLNIWVIKFSSNELGYAQFPYSNLPGLEGFPNVAETDGIVVDYTVFGSIDDGDFPLDSQYNRGRTATHEIGHFFGLRHIWGDVSTCSGNGDYVADTPPQNAPTYNCPPHPQISCSNNKMFQNYLDFSDDVCMNIFTQGQINRMQIILDDPTVPRRNSLLSSPALLDPNCDVLDVAILAMAGPGPVVCDPNSPVMLNIRNRGCSPVTSFRVAYAINSAPVSFFNKSLDNPLGINQSATITLHPLVLTQGINAVFIAVDQVNGSPDEDPDNSTLLTYVVVDPSEDRIPLRENFDMLTWPTVSLQAGMTWQPSTTNFGTSASVQAFQQGTIGEETWMVSPALDFSVTHKASVFFDLSYAWNQTSFDRLRILASTDCGSTYPITLFDRSGPNLANEVSIVPWIPLSSSQWGPRQFLNLNALAGSRQVRLAFVFNNARGNNMYLDNVEFFLSDDPNPVNIGADLYSIYWNSQSQAAITFDLPKRMPVQVQVVDILGRSFIDTTVPDVLNQTHVIELNNAASGIYLMRLLIDGLPYVTKFYLP